MVRMELNVKLANENQTSVKRMYRMKTSSDSLESVETELAKKLSVTWRPLKMKWRKRVTLFFILIECRENFPRHQSCSTNVLFELVHQFVPFPLEAQHLLLGLLLAGGRQFQQSNVCIFLTDGCRQRLLPAEEKNTIA